MIEIDNLVIGAGIFGCHAATVLSKNGSTMLLEKSSGLLDGMTRWNHGRVHNGLHYLSDYDTASQANENYKKFITDNFAAINKNFNHIYAIEKSNSKSSVELFEKTADNFNIKYEKTLNSALKFKNIAAAYSLEEPSFDILELKNIYIQKIKKLKVKALFSSTIIDAEILDGKYVISILDMHGALKKILVNKTIVIAAYSQTNEVLESLGLPKEDITYVLGKQIYAYIPHLKDIGITVVDGAFVSLSPFGFSGLHAVNSVAYSNFLSTDNREKLKEFTRPPNSQFYKEVMEHADMYTDTKNTYIHSSMEYSRTLFNYSKNPESRKTSIKMISSSPEVYAVISGKISNIYEIDKLFV
jgi:hypothetical protein